MDNLINLGNFKKNKEKEKILEKSEKAVDEMKLILQILDLTITGLSHFTKYVVVTECISVLESNKILLQIHLKKYNKAMDKIKEDIKNGKLEETGKENT
jgi:hypothetical protein